MITEEEQMKLIEKLVHEALDNPAVAHNNNTVVPLNKGEGFGWKEKIGLWYTNKKNTFIVTMYYRNKTVETFTVKGTAPYFVDNKQGYILYTAAGWFDLNHSQTHLCYAEGFAMPIDTISVRGDLATLSIKPSNVREVIDGEEIKIVLTAQSLTKWIKLAILLIGIVLFIVFILAVVQVMPLLSQVFSKVTNKAVSS